MKKIISSIVLIGVCAISTYAQIGKCKGKYLGNIIAYSIPSNYSTLWNQVTSENGSKWGSVEGTKGTYNWTNSDLAYNWAKNNGGIFKYHNFVWGSQTPSWVSSATVAEIQAAVENYIKAAAAHYGPMGGLSIIDVLHEPVNTAISSNYKAALTAGYQADPANAADKNNTYGWAIWPFQLARKYFPNATLLINEYNIEMNWNNCRTPYMAMVNAIKNAPNLTDGNKNLIDGVGLQCHGINNLTAANFKACIDQIWNTTGVPIHITEIDITADPSEAYQQSKYAELLPVAWEHPHVAGITIWGYIQGSTWIPGNGVAGPTGTDTGLQYATSYSNPLGDRPAMTWIKSYFAGITSLACCPSPAPFASCNGTCSTPAPTVTSSVTYALNATATALSATGTALKWYTVATGGTASTTAPTPSTTTAGTTIYYVSQTLNGCEGVRASITVNVTAPALNGTITIRAKGVAGSESINLEVAGAIIQTWTLTTAYADYTATANVNGKIRVNYTNDATGLDAQVDYIVVAGTTYQAENQVLNTAFYANGSCGGGSNSEMMHCSGYIEFVTTPVTPTPLPTVTTPVTYCQNVTATALTATGTALKWYTVATGGTGSTTAPTPSTTTVGSTTYYVSQTLNTVESNRAAIVVTINASPAAPTVTSPITYTQAATATALTATGTALKWYTVATGGTSSATAPTPSTATIGTTNYYVSQTVNTCESPRSQILVNVIAATLTQTLTLDAGWNLISLNVVPSNYSIATIFAPILSNVDIVKNADGFYKVGQAANLQSLTQLALGGSYLVKMKTAQTLTVTGTGPGTVTVPLKKGWNMLGYPVSTTKATTTVLSTIWTNTQTIKNFDGFLDHTSGTLNTMIPGEGYFIYMNAAGSIGF